MKHDQPFSVYFSGMNCLPGLQDVTLRALSLLLPRPESLAWVHSDEKVGPSP